MLMPIQFHLRKYLETTNMFQTILACLHPSKDGHVRSLVDGSIWKQRTAGVDKIVIPLNLFFDDFTTSDTVSPHASRTSICAIYYYIPCLPGHLLSKLANILVAGYILTEDRKQYENDELFSILVDILIQLETEGLDITYEGKTITVHFMLGFITGDNLGISGILDLVESARANFYCRVCKRNRAQREIDVREYPESFRSVESYYLDLDLGDVSMTGIKKDSIFNRIPSYHVALNIYFDLMHDLWEGVCVYGLAHCLKYFVTTKKMFSLDELNARKNLFVFGSLNNSNIPNDIKDVNIAKSKIKLTASEIKTLLTFFPLIVGKAVPNDDSVWKYLCGLLKICHILMLREFPLRLVETLRKLVEIHHSQYQELFNDTLKPKHHNLLHYASSLLTSGTPRHQWAMRGEGKHREAKQYSRVSNNKINLCKSLSIKAGYKFAYNVLNNAFIPPTIEINESDIKLESLRPDHQHLLGELGNNITVEYIDRLIKKGSTFEKGTIFYTCQENFIKLFELESIFRDNKNTLTFICTKINSNGFNDHLQSFEVYKSGVHTIVSNVEETEVFAINLHKVDETFFFRFCNFVDLV